MAAALDAATAVFRRCAAWPMPTRQTAPVEMDGNQMLLRLAGQLPHVGVLQRAPKLPCRCHQLDTKPACPPPCSDSSPFPLSLIHISEPTRRTPISYAVFCLKKKNTQPK